MKNGEFEFEFAEYVPYGLRSLVQQLISTLWHIFLPCSLLNIYFSNQIHLPKSILLPVSKFGFDTAENESPEVCQREFRQSDKLSY